MLTLPSVLDRTRRLYGARPATVDPEAHFTWAEFVDRVARLAGALAAQGLGPGKRFGILCRNTFRHYELLHAGYWLGAVPVPINWRLAPPEIRFILDDASCTLLAIEAPFVDLIAKTELAPWRERALFIGRQSPEPNWPATETLIARTAPIPARDAAEEEDAILLYTGGTTGRSKGVRLTHRNVVANGAQCAVAMKMAADDVYLHVAPMFHSADLLGTGYTMQGAAHAFLPAFTPKAFLGAIEQCRATVCMLPPTVIILTLQEPEFDRYDLSSYRRLFYGSAPMDVEWIKRTRAKFATVAIQQGYGLTETAPILTTLDEDEHERALESRNYERLRAAGRPVIGVDLKIIDDRGEEVPTGQVGEVAVRGPNVTVGYLNRPEENARAFHKGWFRTGDLGRVDAEGFMYLLDRLKDMIVTGGENVYCSEVEAVLYQHPAVHETAVIGVPDPIYGEALLAVIVPAPGQNLTADEIIAHCRGKIGGYKIPRRIAVLDQMPKSAMGKILKTELRRMFARDAAKV